jgi:hypothetical protein
LKVEGLQNVGTAKEFQAENLLENFFSESKMKPTANLMLKNAVFSFYKHNRRALEGQTASNIKNETPESKMRKPTLEDLESVKHSARDKSLNLVFSFNLLQNRHFSFAQVGRLETNRKQKCTFHA